MIKRILCLIISAICILGLCSCSSSDSLIPSSTSTRNSTFKITFIDVGQGDSALVECDGHYMLIDGGSKSAGDKVYNTLCKEGVTTLDILAISHLHEDHYGGLIKALSYASNIETTICNKNHISGDTEDDGDDSDNPDTFKELEKKLNINKTEITVPSEGTKYSLGSATVEVVSAEAEDDNDSLVLLITYGKTTFLFTGDIESAAQNKLIEKFYGEYGEKNRLTLLKMPHHGASIPTTYHFLDTFLPENVVISVGAGNRYGHPSENTISKLNDLKKQQGTEIYRTDKNGDITVKSNGKEISISTSK